MMTSSIKSEIVRLASANYAEETCGFVLSDYSVVEVPNVAQNRRCEFEIDPKDYARYEPQIRAIWHSHPGDAPDYFSPADVLCCKESRVPWILYHVESGEFKYADPTGRAPYIGRDWVYGVNDCFGLVTDWLRRELNFDFPDVHRYHDKPEPSQAILTAFPDLMRRSGLVETKGTIYIGDVLFMQINSPLPNHCAVVVDDKKNKILHHLQDRLSGIDYYGTYWRNVTHSVWRVK